MKRWIFLFLALCLAGCAQGKMKSPFSISGFLSSQDLKKRKQAEVEKGRLRDLTPPEMSELSLEEYRLGPGDKIRIEVAKRPELSNEYTVSEKGFLVFPLVGEVPANGFTLPQLQEKLAEALLKYLRQPVVKATVTEYGSQQVIVFGAVGDFGADKQMGFYTLKKPTRLLPFLAGVGGPRTDADLRNIALLHKNGSRDAIDLNRILFQGDTRVNPYLQGGDTLLVPSIKTGKNKVLVLGAVRTPGIYSFDQDLTALEAVTLAGSFIRASTPEKTFVIRTNVENPYRIQVDLKRVLLRGETQRDLVLKKGDIVFVPPNTIATYNQYMADIRPTLEMLIYATSITINADTIAGIFDRGFGKSSVELADESAQRAAERAVLSTPRTTTTTTETTATTSATTQ